MRCRFPGYSMTAEVEEHQILRVGIPTNFPCLNRATDGIRGWVLHVVGYMRFGVFELLRLPRTTAAPRLTMASRGWQKDSINQLATLRAEIGGDESCPIPS